MVIHTVICAGLGGDCGADKGKVENLNKNFFSFSAAAAEIEKQTFSHSINLAQKMRNLGVRTTWVTKKREETRFLP
jgi:hypothetical protein